MVTAEETMIQAIIMDRSQARGAADRCPHGTLGAIADGDIGAIDTLRGNLSRDLGEGSEDGGPKVESGSTDSVDGPAIPELPPEANEPTA